MHAAMATLHGNVCLLMLRPATLAPDILQILWIDLFELMHQTVMTMLHCKHTAEL